MYHRLWLIIAFIEGYLGVVMGIHYNSALLANLLRHFVKDSDRYIL